MKTIPVKWTFLCFAPRISQGVHAYLKERQVPHIWHVDGNAHDPTHWRNNLWLFSQHLFK